MRVLKSPVPWKQVVTLTLLGVLGMLPALAADPSMVQSIEAHPAGNQIILKLSSPNKATLMSPIEQGQRRLLVDIKGASLQELGDKDALLKAIQDQLKDVTQITLDEFRGPQPLVRLMVKTRDPEIMGALLQDQGQMLVLQLLKTDPAQPRQPLPNGPSAAKHADTFSDPMPADDRPVPPPVLSAQTSLEVKDTLFQRKAAEAESARRQRDRLSDQVKTLRELVDKQNAMINHLKVEQGRLVRKESNAVEKEQIIALQRELKELMKSYEQMKYILGDYRKEVTALEEQLREAQIKLQAEEEARGASAPPPVTGESRGSMLTTLASLDQNSINRLIEAEKNFRDAKKADYEGDLKKADQLYQKAISSAPQVKEYALSASTFYANKMKNMDNAHGVLENALYFNPDDIDILNELGKLALSLKKYNEARDYFRQAMPTGLLSNYASTLNRFDRVIEAENIYKLALSSKPKDSDLHFNLGNLYMGQKRFKEAQERFAEAVKLSPNFAEAHYHLGLSYAEQGNYPMAIDSLATYLELMPNAPNKDAVKIYLDDLKKVSDSGQRR